MRRRDDWYLQLEPPPESVPLVDEDEVERDKQDDDDADEEE